MDSEYYRELTRHEYLAFLENAKRKAERCKRQCMYPGCSEDAIYSHVFQQKNQQLAEITAKGKVYAFTHNHLFAYLQDKPLLEYKEIGLSKLFGFYGLCNSHDTALFAPIERTDCKVDWYDEKNQYLLAYRTLCREIFANKVVREISSEVLDNIIFSSKDLSCQSMELASYGDTTPLDHKTFSRLEIQVPSFGNAM